MVRATRVANPSSCQDTRSCVQGACAGVPRLCDVSGGGRQRLQPSPPPLEVDLGRIMLVGTMVWAVALVVSAVLVFLDVVGPRAPIICAAGLVAGSYGVWWSRRHERRRTVDPQDDVAN